MPKSVQPIDFYIPWVIPSSQVDLEVYGSDYDIKKLNILAE